jgi:hypothetical protein
MSGTETTDTGSDAAGVCGRDRAVLRAVAAGRCQLRAGCEPVLLIDGVACADSGVARRLMAAGLIAPPVAVAEQARLTAAGRAALGAVPA